MSHLLFAHTDIRAYRHYALESFPDLCRPRPEESHKNMFGTVGVLGGSRGMSGAAFLAAEAALYGGCGRVVVGLAQNPLPGLPARCELMVDGAAETLAQYGKQADVWVVGCGLAHSRSALELLQVLWREECSRLVLDAGALTLLATHRDAFAPAKRAELVLTPHPGEAAKLLDTSVAQIQGNRHWAARELSSRYRAWVVLKGHETVISSARGFLVVNPTGNAGLATAGSGDVLAGLIGSLLGQGLTAEQAVPAAVWLHGAAADILAAAQIGPIGLTAGELMQAVRWLRNRIVAA